MKKIKKLKRQAGFPHILTIVAIVAAFGAVGAFMLVRSSAASCNQIEYRQGTSGTCVQHLQGLVNWYMKDKAGAPAQLTPDGKFGALTKSAVLFVQGLSPSIGQDGIVGALTWYRLCNPDSLFSDALRDVANKAGCYEKATVPVTSIDNNITSIYFGSSNYGNNITYQKGKLAIMKVLKDGKYYRLDFQSDGNLVYYKSTDETQRVWSVIWASGTENVGNKLVFEMNCNVAIYNAAGSRIWETKTGNTTTACKAAIPTYGLIISNYKTGDVLWSSQTAVFKR